MKKHIAFLSFLFTLFLSTSTYAAETFYSVDDTIETLNQTIAAHEAEVEFEAYFDLTQEEFWPFFQDTIIRRLTEQFDDHGQLISRYTVSYLCIDKKCEGTVGFEYHSPKQEYLAYKQFIAQLAAQNQHLTYAEKISFVNNYLVQHTEYDHAFLSKPSPHSPVSIFHEGLGVCQAYAVFAHDLLKALGVQNYLLNGVANGDAHLWNVLKDATGNIVHLDTTWNDTSRTNDYYLISSAQIAKTHAFSATSLTTITNLLNASPLPDSDEEQLKPDFTHHAMYVYAKEFLETKHTTKHLTDLGTLTNNQAFEIKFNESVAGTQDFKVKVFITDNKGAVVDIKAAIDGQFVRVYKEDDEKFKPNEQYNLVILKGIESEKSRNVYLKESVYVTFTVAPGA